VKTLDLYSRSHEYMDRDDEGLLGISVFGWEIKSIHTYFIVFLFILIIYLCFIFVGQSYLME
jgi:hypothetical protein